MIQIGRKLFPQSNLGKKLWALRKKAIAAGVPILSEEEVLDTVSKRRNETSKLRERRHSDGTV